MHTTTRTTRRAWPHTLLAGAVIAGSVVSGTMVARATSALAQESPEDAAMGRRVQELLRAHGRDVYDCVSAAHLATDGELLVRAFVGEGQRPARVEVLAQKGGVTPALMTCLTGKMQAWDLAPLHASAGDQVVFPLVFQPGARLAQAGGTPPAGAAKPAGGATGAAAAAAPSADTKPTPLQPGQKRVVVTVKDQEVHGHQRFIIDEQSVGEPPLVTVEQWTIKPKQSLPEGGAREEEEVLYVLEGKLAVPAGVTSEPAAAAPAVAAAPLGAGDVLLIAAGTHRPELKPADAQALKVLAIAAHGGSLKGLHVIRAADAKEYDYLDGKVHPKLLLDGSGAKLAVQLFVADAGAAAPLHKHTSDEVVYVLAGKAHGAVGKGTYEIGVGDAVRIPAGTMHTFEADEAFRGVQIYAPAGPEQRFKPGAVTEKPRPARGTKKGKR